MWLALGSLAYGLFQIAILLCGLVGLVVEIVLEAKERIVIWCSGAR